VIGAGAAGLTAADFAARLGVSVALIEAERIGGDCTWSGCVPTKTLLHAGAIAHSVRTGEQFGVTTGPPKVDFHLLRQAVRDASARVYATETPETLRRRGIAVIGGAARFLDPHTIEVNRRRIRADRFIISAGARPAIPPIPGLHAVPFLTYQTVFDLPEQPRRLLIVGGGPTGCEIAQAFQWNGTQTTLVEQEDRLLPPADPEASEVLARVLREEGVDLRLGQAVTMVDRLEAGIRARVGDSDVTADQLLVAAGRRPAVAGIGLKQAGVRIEDGAIATDEYLRTSQRHIYAAGDVTGGQQFTHYAGWQGGFAARNALLPGAHRGVRASVPWAVFTDPVLAQVGQTEREATRDGRAIGVHRWPIERIDRGQTQLSRHGFLKLISDHKRRLTGATVVLPRGDELANALSLAIERGLTLGELATAMQVYPTFGSALQQASAEAFYRDLTAGWKGRLVTLLARWRP
jgi:pyruvate/2-oxoglutarate dehydrogenase complex dihydrolipoamide dehydrogenase (E3) component